MYQIGSYLHRIFIIARHVSIIYGLLPYNPLVAKRFKQYITDIRFISGIEYCSCRVIIAPPITNRLNILIIEIANSDIVLAVVEEIASG